MMVLGSNLSPDTKLQAPITQLEGILLPFMIVRPLGLADLLLILSTKLQTYGVIRAYPLEGVAYSRHRFA